MAGFPASRRARARVRRWTRDEQQRRRQRRHRREPVAGAQGGADESRGGGEPREVQPREAALHTPGAAGVADPLGHRRLLPRVGHGDWRGKGSGDGHAETGPARGPVPLLRLWGRRGPSGAGVARGVAMPRAPMNAGRVPGSRASGAANDRRPTFAPSSIARRRRRARGTSAPPDSAHERRHRAGLSAQARAPAHRRGQELRGAAGGGGPGGPAAAAAGAGGGSGGSTASGNGPSDGKGSGGSGGEQSTMTTGSPDNRNGGGSSESRDVHGSPCFARTVRLAVGRGGRRRRGWLHAPRRRRPQPRRRPRAGPEHVQPVRRGRRQGVQDGAGGEAAARHRRGGEAPSRAPAPRVSCPTLRTFSPRARTRGWTRGAWASSTASRRSA